MKKTIVISYLLFSFICIYSRPCAQGYADSPWPMYGHDPCHTHRGGEAPPTSNKLKWKFKTDGSVFSPAIGSDGTIYAGSYDGHLYAFTPDGALKWKFQTEGPINGSSPAVGNDGTIYIGSEDHFIYAINPDGTSKWEYETGYVVISPATIGRDGTVYIRSWDLYLYVFHADGSLKWKYLTIAGTSPPAVGSDNTIYVVSYNYLCALNPDGTMKWQYDVGFVHTKSSPSIGNDGTVYIGALYKVYAINPDGTLKWVYETTDRSRDVRYFNISGIGCDGTLYAYSYFYFVAIDPDGALKWRFRLNNRTYESGAIGSDGCIYIGDSYGNMYAINPDGALKWKIKPVVLDDINPPAIGSDGSLYFGSDDHYLYALAPEYTAVMFEPDVFNVEDPFPNPFNTINTVHYALKENNFTEITVYNALGQKIRTLVNGKQAAGVHAVQWNGRNDKGVQVASGVYFYRIDSGAFVKTRRMMLVE